MYILDNPKKFYVDASAVIKEETTSDDLLKIELRHWYTLENWTIELSAGSTGEALKSQFLKKKLEIILPQDCF